MVRIKTYIYLTVLCLWWGNLEAQDMIQVDGADNIPLLENMQIIADFDDDFAPENLEMFTSDYEFKKYKDIPSNAQNKNISYWIKLKINNSTRESQAYILECYDPKIEQIQIFRRKNTGWKSYSFGSTLNFSEKIIKHKNFHLPIVFEPESQETLYIKMFAERRISFKWVLRKNHVFINYALKEYTFQGFVSGFIFMLIVFNFFMFLASKQKVYSSFIFYISGNLLYILSINGIGFQYLWPAIPFFNTYASGFFSLLMNVGLYLYLGDFLQIKHKNEGVFKIFRGVIFVRIGLFIAGIVFHELLYDVRFDLVIFAFALFIGLKFHQRNNKSHQLFLAGLYTISIALLVHVFWFQGYVDDVFPSITNHLYFVYALALGILIELCCFTAAIAFQLKNLFEHKVKQQGAVVKALKEKNNLSLKANQNLETIIHKRDAELEIKDKELQEVTNSLNTIHNKQTQEELVKEVTSTEQQLLIFSDFKKKYPTKAVCLQLLEELKWKEGYECKKCKHTSYKEAGKDYSRKCNHCYHVESVTVNTLFHRLRFPIQTATYLVYLIHTAPKTTIDELQDITGLRRATVWAFKKKVELAIKYWKNQKIQITWKELILTPVNKIKDNSDLDESI